jgi:hypothetical protein
MPPKEIILMTPSFLKRISATFYRTIWGMPERLGEKTDVQSAPKSDCFSLYRISTEPKSRTMLKSPKNTMNVAAPVAIQSHSQFKRDS